MSYSASSSLRIKRSLLGMKLDEALYYFAFAIYYIQTAIERTTFTEFLFMPVEVFTSFTQMVILLLLFSKFVMQRASFRCWVFSAFVVLVGFTSWRQSGEGWLFWAALFIVCASGVRLRPLAKIAFALSIATLVVTTLFAGCGVIENKIYVRMGVTRYALGFTHPNTLGLYLLNMCVAFSVLHFGKNPLPDIMLLAVAVTFNLTFADSRTTAVLSLVQAALLLVFYFAKEEGSRRFLRYAFIVAVFASVAVSAYFMVAYNPANPIHLALNYVLSGRLRLASAYYEMQPFTLLGSDFTAFSPIYWENGKPYTFVVDNAWCHLVLRYGLIPTFLFLSGYLVLLFKVVRRRKWDALLFGLVLMSVYGLSETLGIRIECNFFLYAVGADLLYAGVFSKEKAVGDKIASVNEVEACRG